MCVCTSVCVCGTTIFFPVWSALGVGDFTARGFHHVKDWDKLGIVCPTGRLAANQTETPQALLGGFAAHHGVNLEAVTQGGGPRGSYSGWRTPGNPVQTLVGNAREFYFRAFWCQA